MSPEQARGQANLTAQSDQFSLGLVLYELAAGKRAFQRDSAAETMTAIIREDPEPLPNTVPAPLRWIVERLLHKEPAERYDSTRDLYRELRQLRDRLSESVSASATPASETTQAPPKTRRNLLWLTLAAGIILGGIAVWAFRPVASAGSYKFTPMEVSWENPTSAVWSPDGKAFVYAAGAANQRRVFLRYLNSSDATPLTSAANRWVPVGWTPDSKRVWIVGPNPQAKTPPSALLSVPVTGGVPEFIAPVDASAGNGFIVATVSPDGKTFAVLRRADDGKFAVFFATPPDAPLMRYAPAPFEATINFSQPLLRFSPDGQSLTLLVDVPGEKQAWRLPFPAGQRVPQQFLRGLRSYGSTPQLSWFPDGRTGVLAWTAGEDQPVHLWLAGLHSGARRQITSGAGNSGETSPSVSPDGKKILYTQNGGEYIILSASLSDATLQRVVSSTVPMGMPAWALHQDKFVYESARNGASAIWMRAEGWDRQIVTASDFPPQTTRGFMSPALSPGTDRIVYSQLDRDQHALDWISSVSGGPPVRLTNDRNTWEAGGVWSPDGNRFVYLARRGDVGFSLMLAKTSGEATPVVLREKLAGNPLPSWSPDGKWITFIESAKDTTAVFWNLISPDGQTVRRLLQTSRDSSVPALTFSADSQRVYGIRTEPDHNYLFSFDIASGKEKVIGDLGKDATPNTYRVPGIRLTLSPDGKSVLFASYKTISSLWMLEGFDPPGWAMRLREMLPW